jgi:hypothetical protein
VATLCGLLAWKEYRNGDAQVKLLAILTLLCFAGGVAAISLASFYTKA